jgi:hypothetical protein
MPNKKTCLIKDIKNMQRSLRIRQSDQTKWANDLKRLFTKDVQMAYEPMKRCPPS